MLVMPRDIVKAAWSPRSRQTPRTGAGWWPARQTLIRRRGGNATSFREVVRHTQTPRGSIGHHFPARQAATRRGGRDVRRSGGQSSTGAPDERAGRHRGTACIIGLWRSVLEGSHLEAGCPVPAVAVEQYIGDDDVPACGRTGSVAGPRRDVFADWQRIIAAALRRDGVSAARARRLAALVVASVEGTVALCRVERTAAPLDDVGVELEIALSAAVKSRLAGRSARDRSNTARRRYPMNARVSISTASNDDRSYLAETHEVINVGSELHDYDMYRQDAALVEAVQRDGAAWADAALGDFGRLTGSADYLELGVQANRFQPELETPTDSATGSTSLDSILRYHQLMRTAIEHGLHSSPWTDPRPGAHVARAAQFYLHSQVEAGHCCPVTMTFAAVPSLQTTPELAAVWLPRVTACTLRSAQRPILRRAASPSAWR